MLRTVVLYTDTGTGAVWRGRANPATALKLQGAGDIRISPAAG